MVKAPEDSDYTSIQQRIHHALSGHADDTGQPSELMPFVGNPRENMPKGLPFPLSDYLELVDWAGRARREGKRGGIPSDALPILERLNIEPQYWLFLTTQFKSRFKGLVGTAYKLKAACASLGYRRTPGLASCRQPLT